MKIGEKVTKDIVEKETGKTYCQVTFEVFKSGAFQYGNQTSVEVTYTDGSRPMSFDTRYFKGDLKDFIESWSEDQLNKERYELK